MMKYSSNYGKVWNTNLLHATAVIKRNDTKVLRINLTLPAPCISESYIKEKLTYIFIFTFLCGISKGALKDLKAFIKPFEAPQRILKRIGIGTRSVKNQWARQLLLHTRGLLFKSSSAHRNFLSFTNLAHNTIQVSN